MKHSRCRDYKNNGKEPATPSVLPAIRKPVKKHWNMYRSKKTALISWFVLSWSNTCGIKEKLT